jgi:hypothetical protein
MNESMTKSAVFKIVILGATTAMALSACTATRVDRKKLETQSHYWQRSSTTSSLYMRGDKAQQILNRDIAQCLAELKELERIGAIRKAVPAAKLATATPDATTPAGEVLNWDSMQHDGNLRAEYLDYHDFEGCMQFKGWQRTKYVPYDASEVSKRVYVDSLNESYDDRYRSRIPTITDGDVQPEMRHR